jgi:hypothetical protein
MCIDTRAWDRKNTRKDVDSKSRDSLNYLISLKIPVNPPYFKRPKTPLNDLGLPIKQYYTTRDICKVLNIYPDTFHYRLKVGYYPEPRKVGGKRRFSEQDIQ